MKKIPDNLRIKANDGFSLVDVMVGMVIALLGVIIIFQVFAVSEGIKRTTTSGGDAVQNGAVALLTLERSLKEAGYGIFSCANVDHSADLGCPAPVTINPLGAVAINASDSVVLSYRQTGRLAGTPCSVVSATGLSNWDFGSFPPKIPNIDFASAAPPALTVETISVQATVVNGHTEPQLCSNVNGVISDGIVLLKAEYGADLNGNGVIDAGEWTQAGPALSAMAVRLAVVARSAQPEKPSVVGGACDTTTVANAPTWNDGTAMVIANQANFLAADGEWQCYRYKTFEITVPLRNR